MGAWKVQKRGSMIGLVQGGNSNGTQMLASREKLHEIIWINYGPSVSIFDENEETYYMKIEDSNEPYFKEKGRQDERGRVQTVIDLSVNMECIINRNWNNKYVMHQIEESCEKNIVLRK